MELTTTIMIGAPHEIQAIAAPTLRQYAFETLIRVPAHITVLYPFVPFEQLDSACVTLRDLCAEIAPFDITMKGYNSFPDIVYMEPQDDTLIRALCQKVFSAFPDCPPYRGIHGNEPTPHMTVGEFASAEEQAAALLPDYEPVTFRAAQLHVMYGVDNSAMTWLTHAVIALRNGQTKIAANK